MVDSVLADKSNCQHVRRVRTQIESLANIHGKDRVIREITARLMALNDRAAAARVAALVEMACANTPLVLPVLATVEAKTVMHEGRCMHLPPNPDVTDQGFVLIAEETSEEYEEWELIQ